MERAFVRTSSAYPGGLDARSRHSRFARETRVASIGRTSSRAHKMSAGLAHTRFQLAGDVETESAAWREEGGGGLRGFDVPTTKFVRHDNGLRWEAPPRPVSPLWLNSCNSSAVVRPWPAVSLGARAASSANKHERANRRTGNHPRRVCTRRVLRGRARNAGGWRVRAREGARARETTMREDGDSSWRGQGARLAKYFPITSCMNNPPLCTRPWEVPRRVSSRCTDNQSEPYDKNLLAVIGPSSR